MPIPKKIMEVLDNRNIPDKKLEKIEQFLNGEISAKELYNLGHFN